MNVLLEGSIPIKIWSDLDKVEPQAREQLRNIARLPYIFRHVAVMPDVHLGIGATVGSVIASKGAISPSAVGVDIGCGMLAAPLGCNIDDLGSLSELRAKIENAIPVGFSGHDVPQNITDLGVKASDRVRPFLTKAALQMGTLGGGNHFVEICDGGNGEAWLMLHSGSRGAGNQIAQIHIKNAKRLMDVWQIKLSDPDLAYIAQGTPDFDQYIQDLHWAQDYAMANRLHMLATLSRVLGIAIDPANVVNCHHNYVSQENHFGENVLVTRKGAVRARVGDRGIIPGSMGQRSYIVRGLGNPESFCSCSHGAGRLHSRNAAKRLFTVEDLASQTEGVECRKDIGVLDEIPSAYKSIDEVMANQSDLVSVERELKAVLCVKG